MTALTASAWTLRYEQRPPSLNVVLNHRNRWVRATLTKEWRNKFAELATDAGIPPLHSIHITAIPHLKNRRSMPDTGACLLAVKAAIDGLVDAGVLPDDGPDHVRTLLFVAPAVTGVDALELEVRAD